MGMRDDSEGGSAEFRDFPAHLISKETRYKLVELMLSTRSIAELSRDLGVSTTAISKYIKRYAYPSNQILQRLLTRLAPYERDKAVEYIINDVVSSLEKLYNSLNEKERRALAEAIKKVIK